MSRLGNIDALLLIKYLKEKVSFKPDKREAIFSSATLMAEPRQYRSTKEKTWARV